MKMKNLMIGLVASAALAQIGIGAANASVNFSYDTTGGTVAGSSGSSYLAVNGVGTTSGTAGATNLTLFTITPTIVGTGQTDFSTPISVFSPSVTITYNGYTDTLNLPNTVNFSGVLSSTKDTVKVDLQKPNFDMVDIDGEDFTVTLTTKSNPGASGSPGYIDGKITAMKASPAPEPSEVGTLVLCTFGLLGLMVRARKARAIGASVL
jgi:hypothetical protein